MAKLNFELIPNSWALDDWPCGIYPGKTSRARYTIRSHRDELIRAGALVRIGRDLVIMGAAYVSWLHKQSNQVDGYDIAPNRVAAESANVPEVA
jgi:hypothetical protein